MSRRLPPGAGKTKPLGMRTDADLRAMLEDAAARSGRSLAQECEARLAASFHETSLERTIAEQMAKIIQPAVDEAVAKALRVVPEPMGSPPPDLRV